MVKQNKSYQFHGWTIVDKGASWCAYSPKGLKLIDNVESSDIIEKIIIRIYDTIEDIFSGKP